MSTPAVTGGFTVINGDTATASYLNSLCQSVVTIAGASRLCGNPSASTAQTWVEIPIGTNLTFAGGTTLNTSLTPNFTSIGAGTPGSGAFTTLSATSTSTLTGNITMGGASGGLVLTTANAGTNSVGLSFQNTGGGGYILGADNSAGNGIVGGLATPYTFVIGTTISRNVSFVSNNSLALTLDTSQNATFAGTIASTGAVAFAGATNNGIGGVTSNAFALWVSGSVTSTGGNNRILNVQGTQTAASAADVIECAQIGSGNLAKGTTNSGASYYGLGINNPTVTGTSTLATACQLFIAAPIAATVAYAIQIAGGIVAIGNSTAPSSSPSNTGQLYQDAADNKLKYRGASGTITVIALP